MILQRCADYSAFLNGTTESFDIAFLDPPYSAGILQNALMLVSKHMSPQGIIVCEHPRGAELSSPEGFSEKVYNYGKVAVTVFRAP